jgi:hypothetical protein
MGTYNHYSTDFQKLKGRTPWTDIANRPSDHLSKRSRPDTDWNLQEPSHMTLESVDCWLRHWLKLQKKGKRPLVVKDPTAKSSQPWPASQSISKHQGRRAKAPNATGDISDDSPMVGMPADGDIAESTIPPIASHRPQSVIRSSKGKGKQVMNTAQDDSDGLEPAETSEHANMDDDAHEATSTRPGSESAVWALPASPLSMSDDRATRRHFLESLSTDTNYRRMLLLLRAAPVSRRLSSPALADTCQARGRIVSIPHSLDYLGIQGQLSPRRLLRHPHHFISVVLHALD